MARTQPVVWSGSPPVCDFCEQQPQTEFVDGKTTQGPWALMCEDCFGKYGVGLGLGRGQKYQRPTPQARFVKVAG